MTLFRFFHTDTAPEKRVRKTRPGFYHGVVKGATAGPLPCCDNAPPLAGSRPRF